MATVHAAASSGSSATSRARSDMVAPTRATVERRRSRRVSGMRLESAPEHLGDQVLPRREVGVGRRRSDSGGPGDVAHRQPVVAVLAQLFDRRHGQLLHGGSLTCRQLTARRLGRRRDRRGFGAASDGTGHVSRWLSGYLPMSSGSVSAVVSTRTAATGGTHGRRTGTAERAGLLHARRALRDATRPDRRGARRRAHRPGLGVRVGTLQHRRTRRPCAAPPPRAASDSASPPRPPTTTPATRSSPPPSR